MIILCARVWKFMWNFRDYWHNCLTIPFPVAEDDELGIWESISFDLRYMASRFLIQRTSPPLSGFQPILASMHGCVGQCYWP